MEPKVHDGFEFSIKNAKAGLPELYDLCQPTEEEDGFAQYEIDDVRSICWRVVCVNNVPGMQFSKSLLGPTGHLERMNVWTHIFAAVLYLAYAAARPVVYGSYRSSTTNELATAAAGALVATYFISSAYHVASANRFWSAVWRVGDYGGIYVGIAASYLADLSAATRNLNNVPWQAIADLWLASAAMVAFFVVRRAMTPIEETRVPYLASLCAVGVARRTNVDLEHSSLRAAAGSILIFSWVLAAPGALTTLEPFCAGVFLSAHIIGTSVLIAGMAIDNVLFWPDQWMEKRGACSCYSGRSGMFGGWMITSHALWHIIALVSTVCNSIGVEIIVATSDVLSNTTTL